MFIENKYYEWYKRLTTKRDRILDGYTEKHHIVPRSFGGSNKIENLVVLTAREHFIAHLLLTKCTKGVFKQKMGYALWNMVNRDKGLRTNSKTYEIIRNAHIAMLSKQNSGSGNPMFGKHLSNETKEKISAKTKGSKGSKRSLETRAKISKANIGTKNSMFGVAKTEEFILDTRKRMINNNPMKKEEVVARIRMSKLNTINCFDTATQQFVRVSSTEYYNSTDRYKGNNTAEAKQYKSTQEELQSA